MFRTSAEVLNQFRRGPTINIVSEALFIIDDLLDTKRHSRLMVHIKSPIRIRIT